MINETTIKEWKEEINEWNEMLGSVCMNGTGGKLVNWRGNKNDNGEKGVFNEVTYLSYTKSTFHMTVNWRFPLSSSLLKTKISYKIVSYKKN